MAHIEGSPAPDPLFSKYLRALRSYPMLSAEEELDLARRWRDRRDLGAAHRLVTSHMRLLVRIAFSLRGYGLPPNELISAGSVGLMHAVRCYDPDRGLRFARYAKMWIRSAMQQHVLHTHSLVKLGTTAAQKKLFFNLRRLKADMHIIDDTELQPEQVTEIAMKLSVSEDEVVEVNHRIANRDHSLNVPVAVDGVDQWQDSLPDEAENQEAMLAEREVRNSRMAMLPKLLAVLNPRESHIIRARRLQDRPLTLDALAEHYGVSRQRIRQIETHALEKLRKSMRLELAQGTQGTATYEMSALLNHGSALVSRSVAIADADADANDGTLAVGVKRTTERPHDTLVERLRDPELPFRRGMSPIREMPPRTAGAAEYLGAG